MTSAGVIVDGAANGFEKVSGEVVDVSMIAQQLSVRVRLATGVECDMDIRKMTLQSRERVFAGLTQLARTNANAGSQIKVLPSVKTDSHVGRTPELELKGRYRTSTYSFSVSNIGSAAVQKVMIRQISHQTSIGDINDIKINAEEKDTWKTSARAVAALESGKTRAVVFDPLHERSVTSVRTKTLRSISGSSMGTSSTVKSEEVKTKGVYFLVYDEAGKLIYFQRY